MDLALCLAAGRRRARLRQRHRDAGTARRLPAVTGIAPVLVPVTAVRRVLLMVGAMITHVRHGSAAFAFLNLAYLAVAAFAAWGRFGPFPA
ncbi:DoxX family protein [Amycolatopsis tolypomycina]|uniref:DoxX family protein n=1 Tax=Amycolatopsis tolypomycina TaxID=208445 RepID=UPI0033B4C05F